MLCEGITSYIFESIVSVYSSLALFRGMSFETFCSRLGVADDMAVGALVGG